MASSRRADLQFPAADTAVRASTGALAAAEQARDRARALAGAMPPARRLAYARAFCTSVLARYWARLRPSPRVALRAAPARRSSIRLRGDALAVADALSGAASLLDVDEAGYLIGRTYSAMLPDEHRAAHGVFYTPPAIVDRLLDLATAAGVAWDRCRVLDPACGGGAFLGPIARRMIAARPGSDRRVVLRNLSARLQGYEIDPFAAWISAVFLDATLHAEIGAPGGDGFDLVAVCDSLTRHHEPAEHDLIIGNPPYGRVRLSAERRAVFRRSLYGHANLYGLFLDLASARVKPGGVIAYVTPTGFLSGEYFKNLRALLGDDAPPVSLDFISQRARVFDDVLQETLLAVFRRGASRSSVRVGFVDVAADGDLHVARGDDVPIPEPAEQPWIVPRAAAFVALAARLHSLPARLSDWGYRVSTGPLVWNRFKDRLRDRRRGDVVPIIWAEAVSSGGAFSFRAARRNHAPFFAVHDGDDALLVRKPCVLLQRTTAKEQSRRLIAAELPQSFLDEHGGAVTVENHLNMIVPITPRPAVHTRALAAFLNSVAADRAFRCISGTVAVSAYELESMPLPPPWTMHELFERVSGRHQQADIEKYCLRLYGE